jgi:uracil phosphoribosyltransferase
MAIHNLSEINNVSNQYIHELRSSVIQTDRMRFRHNLHRIGELMAFEISKTLNYKEVETETPLGISGDKIINDEIVLISILRAGLPMHEGFLHIFDKADSGFVSAFRSHQKDGSFEISMQYVTCPELENKVVVLIDPMLATGSSIEKTLDRLQEYGTYKQLHICAAIASQQGVQHIKRFFPFAHVWLGAIDEELTAKSYIVPGLGDAGDLAFGPKLQE